MKKWLGIALLIILVVLGIYYFNRYQETQEEPKETFLVPRMEYSDIVIRNITPESARVHFMMLVDNPNLIGFTIDSISYDVYYSGQHIGTSTYADSLSLGAAEESEVSLPISIYPDSLTDVMDSLKRAGADTAIYRLKGHFYLNVPLTDNRKFEFDQEFEAPAYKPPNFSIAEWDFQELDDGDVHLNLTIEAVNFNVFDLEYKDLSYQLYLGDEELVIEGFKPGKINIGKKETERFELPVKLDMGSAASAAWDLITSGKDFSYRLEARLKMVSDKSSLKDSPVNITAVGELEGLAEFL